MKTICLLFTSCFISLLATAQQNGERPFNDSEMHRWARVCEWMQKMLPAQFKDYTIKQDGCAEFAWAEINGKGQFLTMVTDKNIPYGNHPNFNIAYSRNEDSVSMDEQRIMLGLNDALKADNTYDQYKYSLITDKVDKLNQGKTLTIYAVINNSVYFDKKYHIGTTPEKIDLPIPAFAYFYSYGGGKTLHPKGAAVKPGAEGMDYYMNKAVIIIGATPPRLEIIETDEETGWQQVRIYPTDKASDITTAPIKNIMIEMNGGEEDMRAMIKLIDWKGLAGLIGK